MQEIKNLLASLKPALQDLDSLGRIIACLGLWQLFDKLRTEDAPFDREQFKKYIKESTSWALARAEQSKNLLEEKSGSPIGDVVKYTGDLYAKCWVNYGEKDFDISVSFFEKRLRNNNIDVRIIKNCHCLDLGCGGGRYSIALHLMGAASVIGVDVSSEALEDAKFRRNSAGISPHDVQFESHSALQLPANWESKFDFAVCNGVLHHTPDPKKGLTELGRVLKPEGWAFAMLYGSGSLEWHLTDFIRDLMLGVQEGEVRSILHLLDLPVGKIFHIMDRWFVPFYEQIDGTEFETRAKSAGFSKAIRMHRGLYLNDGSERKWRYPEDEDLTGEGEIRYMIQKS